MDFAFDLARIFAAAYALNLAAYFGFGKALLLWNARHPERRIQPSRDGLARARAEILESVRSIAVTAACLALALALQRHGLTPWTPWTAWNCAAAACG